MKSIYVGNLPYSATEQEVRDFFGSFGEVKLVKLVIDRETNRPKGFGFVEMDDAAAQEAIQALDGQEFGGDDSVSMKPEKERNGRVPSGTVRRDVSTDLVETADSAPGVNAPRDQRNIDSV